MVVGVTYLSLAIGIHLEHWGKSIAFFSMCFTQFNLWTLLHFKHELVKKIHWSTLKVGYTGLPTLMTYTDKRHCIESMWRFIEINQCLPQFGRSFTKAIVLGSRILGSRVLGSRTFLTVTHCISTVLQRTRSNTLFWECFCWSRK